MRQVEQEERETTLMFRNGETAAAAELYMAYAVYLRAVVRRQLSAQLRTQFDSADIVQFADNGTPDHNWQVIV